MRRRLSALLLLPLLAGCGTTDKWFGPKEPPALPGARVPVLAFDAGIEADKGQLAVFSMPALATNGNWPTSGGRTDHAGGNFALPDNLKKRWSENIGDSLSASQPLMATPVAGASRVFTMDSDSRVMARRMDNGKAVWKSVLASKTERGKATGGGLALLGDRLFASTGYGEVVALNAADGKEIWRRKLASPLRSPPTAADGRIYVVSIENQLIVLAADTGEPLWRHQGFAEAAGLLGAASPAVGADMAVAAYSSGEVYALRADNGRPLWSDNLAPVRRTSGLSTIAAVRGGPVITADGTKVLAISNAGRMVAVDVRSGQRVWEQKIGGSQTPWVGGDTVYVLSGQAQLAALNLADGKVRWVRQLNQFEDAKDRTGPIIWSGPVMAGNRLWLTSSEGRLMAYDPATGAEVAKKKLDHGVSRAPIVADGALFVLDDDAELSAWR